MGLPVGAAKDASGYIFLKVKNVSCIKILLCDRSFFLILRCDCSFFLIKLTTLGRLSNNLHSIRPAKTKLCTYVVEVELLCITVLLL